MKKIFLGVFLTVSFLSSAQIDLRETRFGITAGPTYSRVQNAHNPSGPRYSLLAGIMAQAPIGTTDQFYLEMEAVYFGAGEGGDKKSEKKRNLEHAVYANNYLSIPVNFKGYFSEAESEFFGFAGPRFNILVGQKVKNAPVGKEYYAADSYGKANSFNFGLGLGLGYSYKRQMEIALKYDIGLSDTYPDLKYSPGDIATGDPAVAKKKTEQVMSVGLTYIFE